MKTNTCLYISSLSFIILGIFVLVTIWSVPEVLPYFENTEALTAARVWGDVNGIVLISLGLLWFLGGKMKDNSSKKLLLFGNITIGIILILTASFHHLALYSGPPPPVFVLLTISIIFAFIGWRSGKDD
tara:strand:- start:42 stop:428 length:387 start_codon:yes stop_codon:yes gene_type:complete